MPELSQKEKVNAITAANYEVEMYCVTHGSWRGSLRDKETGYAWPFYATTHEDLIDYLYTKFKELNS